MRIVILDNYDSFTFNLYQLAARLAPGELPRVIRNDAITVTQLRALRPDAVIISPGPGRPENAAYFGICRRVILELGPTTPVLGVCLGHLGIIEAFGGDVIRAPQPRHGLTSEIHHRGDSVFANLPDPLTAMRYHSLIGRRETLPACLDPIAWTADGLVMGVRHRRFPLVGVQFHPESIGTPGGPELVRNFLDTCF